MLNKVLGAFGHGEHLGEDTDLGNIWIFFTTLLRATEEIIVRYADKIILVCLLYKSITTSLYPNIDNIFGLKIHLLLQ